MLLLALLAGLAPAQDVDLGVYTGLFAPGPRHELVSATDATQQQMNLGPALGIRGMLRPIDLLGGEIALHAAANGVPDAGGALVYAYRVHGMVFPPLDLQPIEPFLLAGVGNLGVSSSNDVLGNDVDWEAHAGLGARVAVSPSIALRADLNYLLADRNTELGGTGGHTEVLVGVSWRVTPEGDADNDGLPDSKDRCVDDAETVNGYADDDGCPDELASVRLTILDTEGLPAQGITVLADGNEVGRTDADGVLVVDGQMPESALVLRGEHFHMERPEETTIELVEGDNSGELTMEWMPGRVRIVTRADGKAMDGATARFTGPKDVPTSGVQDGDQLFFLSPGDWQILVTADTYGTELVNLSIGPDERSLIVIEMELEPAKVEVTREEVVILQQILFETGSAEIKGESLDLLREVTGTVLANTHILKIQIQGHTDSQGSASMNRRLSQQRVESVMAWMVEQGVAADKLEAKGFGEDEPIAPNTTPEGRAKNRRVVFLILEQDLTGEAEE